MDAIKQVTYKVNADLQLMHCNWQEKKDWLSLVRRTVFIEEQGVPEALEWDEFDPTCEHVLVTDLSGQPVATGRIKSDGHIGRMAVLKEWRNQGIGSAILDALLEHARQQNYVSVWLHAQITAIPFYEKHGFSIVGEAFVDAGILHKSMSRALSGNSEC